jgi:hypothetical protein
LRYVLNGSSTVRYVFAMYFHPPNNSSVGRTATIIFYALCLLYVLSTVAVVVDLASHGIILTLVSNNSICKNIIFFLSVVQAYFDSLSLIDAESLQFHIAIIQTTANGCCDFLRQCILVRINHLYLSSAKYSRSTVVGLCGVKISMS